MSICNDAHKTAQFWLIWAVLCLNVSAGIGVLAHGLADAAGDFRRLADRPSGPAVPRSERHPAHRDCGDRGRIHRPAVAVQHWRPVLLGIAVRPHRPQEHLLHVLRARLRALCGGALGRACRQHGAVRRLLLHHPVDVWRRVRDRAGLSRRRVRDAVRRRDPWPAAHRLVHRRHHRSDDRQLHSRGADRRRRAARSRSTISPCTFSPACWSRVSSAT